MAADKTTRKELRQPDAFQRAGVEASSWAQAHQRTLVAAIVVLILIGAGIAVASYLSGRGEARARTALATALEPVGRPVADEAPPPTAGAQEKPFATQKEKDEAIVASLTAFRSEYPDTEAAATAALPLGQAQYRLGNYDAALESFDAFLERAPADAPMRALALEGRGYVFEAKGDLEKAKEAFDRMARENKTEFLQGMGTYHRARILIQQDQKEEAAKVLSDLRTAHPTSAAANQASERLNLLASQGVSIPTPAAVEPDAGTPADAG